jgi:hypothetical protein
VRRIHAAGKPCSRVKHFGQKFAFPNYTAIAGFGLVRYGEEVTEVSGGGRQERKGVLIVSHWFCAGRNYLKKSMSITNAEISSA